jgi:hypothetical protein
LINFVIGDWVWGIGHGALEREGRGADGGDGEDKEIINNYSLMILHS